MPQNRYSIRKYIPGDEAAVAELFQDVFGKKQDDVWDWKFKGRGEKIFAVIAEINDRVVGQYTGFRRDLYVAGTKCQAIQICDVMITSSERGQYGSKGIFFDLLKRFIEEHVDRSDDVVLTYGFPSERHYRLGLRLGIYQKVADLIRYANSPPRKRKPLFFYRMTHTTDSRLLSEGVQKIWEKMKYDYSDSVIGERGGDYFKWRYLDRPDASYIYLVLKTRFTNQIAGIGVMSIQDGIAVLIDCICEKDNMDAMIHLAERFTGNCLDVGQFSVFLTEGVKEPFMRSQFRMISKYLTIPRIVNSESNRVDTKVGNISSYFMLGDSDLV